MTTANWTAPTDTAEAPRRERLGGFEATGDVAACLVPLLEALAWRGDMRHAAEALPHLAERLGVQDLRRVMANLGFESREFRTRLDRLDPRLLPCLVIPDRGSAKVCLEIGPSGARLHDGGTGTEARVAARDVRGRIVAFRRREDQHGAAGAAASWSWANLRRFGAILPPLLGLTLWLNAVSLAVPLFGMAVYDRAIAGGSDRTLASLAVGVAIALVLDLGLRALRARAVAQMGARIEIFFGAAAVRHILHLPPSVTERSSVGALVARLREIDRLRDTVSGSVVLTLLELPFVLIFVATVAVLGGAVAAVPLALLAAYLAVIRLAYPGFRRSVEGATEATAQRQALIVDTLAHLGTIRASGCEGAWIERFRGVSAKAALAHRDAARRAGLAQGIAHVLMVGAGVATLALGVERVLGGTMTMGALVAVMALTWRALGPLNTLLLSLGKLEQAGNTLRHVDRLMRLAPERPDGAEAQPRRHFAGRIAFTRVSFRYGPDAEPALSAVSFTAEPGEVIAIVGPNASGKSTLLKLAAGLYKPQAGTIEFDGDNIRQIDPIRLRQSIGYVTQTTRLLHGTVAQNLRLSEPTATDAELEEAAARAGALDDIRGLPDGFRTRLDERVMLALPEGFRQRLCIARALLRRSSILLLDEPGTGLDAAGDAALTSAIADLRGRTTVLMVTHRPSHMRLADRILVLEAGAVKAMGPPSRILPQILEAA